jgi:hypothetical protein
MTAMLILIDPPGRYSPTSTWRAFLKDMLALPQNKPVKRAIETAQNLLAQRRGDSSPS